MNSDKICQPCISGTKPDEAQKNCVPILIVVPTTKSCGDREFIAADGQCIACQDYERSQQNGIFCAPNVC